MAASSLMCTNPNHESGIKHNLLNETDAGPTDECMICLSEITGPKLAHKTCSLQACKPCLLQWLAQNFSCPLCRGGLRFKCSCLMTDDEEAEDEVDRVLAARAARPPPISYRVVTTLSAIHTIPSERNHAVQSDLIWTHINNDVEDSMLLLENEARVEDGLTTISARDLIRRIDDFQLDQFSIQQLWTSSRVLGVEWFYLTRLELRPDVGIWTPLIPDFHLFNSRSRLPEHENEVQAQLEAGSSTLQIPIPTRILADIIRSTRRLYPWEAQDEIRHLYELAQEGITHFGLVDIRGEPSRQPTWDVRGFYALPWPQERVAEGYSTRSLQDFATTDTSARLGWPTQYDQEMIASITTLFQAQTHLNYEVHTHEYYGLVPSEEYENPQTYPVSRAITDREEVMELDYD